MCVDLCRREKRDSNAEGVFLPLLLLPTHYSSIYYSSTFLSICPHDIHNIYSVLQVELFQRSFEEGVQEQDTEQSPALILGSRSHSLIVDTSEASFPLLERPSALSSHRLLSVSTMLGMFVGVVLVLSCLLLALSIRRLLSLRPCSLLEKQLLQDTDEECCQDKKSSAAPSSSSSLPTSRKFSHEAK
jgi:hypothetical protein